MDKKTISKKFKETERELIKLLKSKSPKVTENEDGEEIKADIKSYISKVNEAKVLFDKYEFFARELQDFDDEEDEIVLTPTENITNTLKKQQKNFEKSKSKTTEKKKKTQKKDVDFSTNFQKIR